MNLKPSPLNITEEAPYADDKLGREECAKALTNVLNSAPNGLVLCINGTWGSGKSTFIEMWRAQLGGDFTTMLFNAWESDFVDDAMVALLGDLQTQAESLSIKGCPDPAAEKIAAFKRLGSKLVRGALPFAIKAATAGVVDIDNDTLKDLLVDEAGKVAEAQIEAYSEAKASIAGFKERTHRARKGDRCRRKTPGHLHRRTRPLPPTLRHSRARSGQALLQCAWGCVRSCSGSRAARPQHQVHVRCRHGCGRLSPEIL